MDLHPLNVLVSRNGPVVVDWTNAVRGDPAIDVAVSWALIHAGEMPSGGAKSAIAGLGRNVLLNAFLRAFNMEPVRRVLPTVVEWKCQDENMSAVEIGRMRSLVAGQTH